MVNINRRCHEECTHARRDFSKSLVWREFEEEREKFKKKKKHRVRSSARILPNNSSSDEDRDEKELKRLNNIQNIRGSAVKKMASSETENGFSSSSTEKKNTDTPNKKLKNSKNKEMSIENFLHSSEADNDVEDEEDISFSAFNSNLDTKRKKYSNIDDLAKSLMLHSSEDNVNDYDDLGDDLFSSDKESPMKKKEKNQKEKSEKKTIETSSNEENAGSNNGSEKENSDDLERKKEDRKWRNDALLREKLSDSDTSDDRRRMEKFEKKQKEMRIKKKEEANNSSDSEDIFIKEKPNMKRRTRVFSSDSNASRNSSSVESKSDDSSKKKKKLKQHRRIKTVNSSDSDNEDNDNTEVTPNKGRKNIRKVMDDEELDEKTRRTAREEEARKKRIQERQALFNKVFLAPDMSDKQVEKLVLDFDVEAKKELVSVHPKLLKKLKPHQAEGVKFMWDACFESLKQVEKGVGGGCILAHCMGLGKTLQVITLVYTLLTNPDTKIKTVLVICPLTTVLNWYSEFEQWLSDLDDYESINVTELTKQKSNNMRVLFLQRWKKEGGVMIIGYEMFRSLVNSKVLKTTSREKVRHALLDPGPDLVICDEGHMLKNEKSAITKATAQIKSLRRIVLTGTPLQNNLIEYHCMVQFVKPNLLGDRKEFMNRFVTPITNGQYHDSRDRDVRLMKRRAHVLHKMLDGIVQRFDYKVLTPFLPPKHEFVISVALSDLQAKLYEYYIENKSTIMAGGSRTLFKDYQIMRLIWTHPLAMKINADRKKKIQEKEDSDDSLKDFVVNDDDVSSGSDSEKSVIDLSSDDEKQSAPSSRLTRAQRRQMSADVDDVPQELVANQWWNEFVTAEDVEDIKQGPKLILLFAILRQCELIGDKVLIFSQSIPSLDMIEYFLTKTDEFSQRLPEDSLIKDAADFVGSWTKNADYFRLDGQTPNELRNRYCKLFNRSGNTRARLFLISTKAGGLGINLTAANRVIIFDASWNPSYDIQSIFRVYRFGQTKPCYIYRFLSQGTMEEKIYERQVTKLSVSCRVVDEQQIDRHFSRNEIEELYKFNRKTPSLEETPKFPSDRLMAELLKQYRDVILSYHEHDSLLENVQEEELTEEERKLAWEDYENEKNQVLQPAPQIKYSSKLDL